MNTQVVSYERHPSFGVLSTVRCAHCTTLSPRGEVRIRNQFADGPWIGRVLPCVDCGNNLMWGEPLLTPLG